MGSDSDSVGHWHQRSFDHVPDLYVVLFVGGGWIQNT